MTDGANEYGIRISRVFDASRERVWREGTEPERFADWYGGPQCEVPLDSVSMDVRPGGKWRLTMFAPPDRRRIDWKGEYLEVVPGERLVSTERYDQQWYEGDAVGTVEFTESQGRTVLVTTLRYASKQVRDAVIQSPATSGMESGYLVLDELLASIAAA